MINARTAASAISSPLTSALNNPPSAAAGTATGLDRIDRTLSAGSARASFAVMLERQATGATPAQATPTPQPPSAADAARSALANPAARQQASHTAQPGADAGQATRAAGERPRTPAPQPAAASAQARPGQSMQQAQQAQQARQTQQARQARGSSDEAARAVQRADEDARTEAAQARSKDEDQPAEAAAGPAAGPADHTAAADAAATPALAEWLAAWMPASGPAGDAATAASADAATHAPALLATDRQPGGPGAGQQPGAAPTLTLGGLSDLAAQVGGQLGGQLGGQAGAGDPGGQGAGEGAEQGGLAALAGMGDGPAGASASGSAGFAHALSSAFGASHASLPGATVAEPVGSPAFPAALGEEVRVLVQRAVQDASGAQPVQEARLDLNPAEMGPITVRIAVDGEQAQVHFEAASAATRRALEASLPALADALASSGLQLAGGGVSEQRSPSGGDAGQPGSGTQTAGRSGPGGGVGGSEGEAPGDAGAATPTRWVRAGGGLSLYA